MSAAREQQLNAVEAFERIAHARDRLYNAEQQVKSARARAEDLIAEAVSSAPSSPTWYDAPGVITREKACEAGNLTPLALDRLMGRYRARQPKAKPAPRRKRETKAGKVSRQVRAIRSSDK